MDLPHAVLDLPCITAGTETTAHDYMMHAIRDIDELLGKDYAKQHPELIAQTAAIDFGTTVIARAIEALSTTVENIDYSKLTEMMEK